MSLCNSDEGDALLRVTTTYQGYEADSMRRILSESSIRKLGKDYLNFYASIYKTVKIIDTVDFHDDRERNVILCYESYQLKNFWKDEKPPEEESGETELRISGKFNAETFDRYLEKPGTRDRSMPFGIFHPRSVTQAITAEFPWPLDFDTVEASFDTQSFTGEFKRSSEGGPLQIFYKYESKSDFVTPEDFSDYINEIERLQDKTYYSFTVPKIWVGENKRESPDTEETNDEGELDRSIILAVVVGLVIIVVLLIGFVVLLIIVIDRKQPAPRKPAKPHLFRKVLDNRSVYIGRNLPLISRWLNFLEYWPNRRLIAPA